MRRWTKPAVAALALLATAVAGLRIASALEDTKPERDEKPAVVSLRGTAFTIDGDLRTVKCARYECAGVEHTVMIQRLRGRLVSAAPCDELWTTFGTRTLFVRGNVVRTMRTVGPGATPVSTHRGTFEVFSRQGAEKVFVLFRGTIAGQSGATVNSPGTVACDVPLHEEGLIEGTFLLPGLRKVLTAEEVAIVLPGTKCLVRASYEAEHDLYDPVGPVTTEDCRWDRWDATAAGTAACRCKDALIEQRDVHDDDEQPASDD